MKIEKLLELMKSLRTPGTGCPWDLKQDFKSIVPYTIEEVYEVAEAIDKGDKNELKTELGDLLFQVVFYCQLAEEEGSFDFSDVVTAIVEKMTRRHPHVFSDAVFENEAEFKNAWENNKKQERQAENKSTESSLDGLSKALPALKVAQKMQAKVAKEGFDWQQIEPVYRKIEEELAEVREAHINNNQVNIEEEIGDLLFSVVNLSRHLHFDAENALRRATNKFESRYRQVEVLCREQGKDVSEMSEQQLILLWDRVKNS
ncbi:MAG: nucleoside triphosphate pyrophosphohydrolase [Gammaproteobacteria bacterium]|nr:nucleoside triphosphate pyrophosphohydrolase [Gammaproteobacteria bacterium]